MRYCLSRRTLDKLLRREKSFFSSFSSKINKQVEPSIQDCENAIAPLLDYLEKNLKTLNDNLSETNMQLVVVKIWNEVLNSLEAVLRPPMPETQQQDVASLDEYEEHVILKWLEVCDKEEMIQVHAHVLTMLLFFVVSCLKSSLMVVRMVMRYHWTNSRTSTTRAFSTKSAINVIQDMNATRSIFHKTLCYPSALYILFTSLFPFASYFPARPQ